MTETFGISGGGRSAEDEFIRLTGAEPSTTAAQGDAILDGTPIEIKRASSVTLNQVPAVKFIPLVVYYVPDDDWYVVPASAVVALVSRKNRGQHTENPFESATLSVRNLGDFRVADPGALRDATLAAIDEGARYPELQAAMGEVLQASKDLAAASIEKVRALVEEM